MCKCECVVYVLLHSEVAVQSHIKRLLYAIHALLPAVHVHVCVCSCVCVCMYVCVCMCVYSPAQTECWRGFADLECSLRGSYLGVLEGC